LEGTVRKSGTEERLLLALAEQLKVPLLQIGRRAELLHNSRLTKRHLAAIELTADNALRLIDNYILSTRLATEGAILEPVSVASVLHDTAQALSKLADDYHCKLELHLSGRYEPVMAHRAGLEAALLSLGHEMIEAEVQQSKKPVVMLAAHRGKKGIVAGVFGDAEGLTADMFHRARSLYGQSRQPLSTVTAHPATGIFVADSLLASMAARLRVAHHHKLSGLAATLLPSQQLTLLA
jgi:light-regulated signal transduction histidine kinase (bacteriophytochrome)